MGYFGLLKSEYFLEPEISESFRRLHEANDVRQNVSAGQDSPKYEKSGLTADRAKQYLERLLLLMENDHPYRDSDLTLNQLAEMLSISPHHLSEIINSKLHQNFFDFVNRYRVEEVKKDLENPDKAHLTVLAIAFDAGFNSKSSFNSIFKRFTNLTPSEYRVQQLSMSNKQ